MTQLPVPMRDLHLNEQPAALKIFTSKQTPCVVLEKESLFTMAMTANELEDCQGNVALFHEKISAFLKKHL